MMLGKIFIFSEKTAQIEDFLKILRKLDFFVSSFDIGAEGIESFSMRTPDLIITDLVLKDMSCFALIEKIRYKWRGKNIPFVILTSNVNKESILKSIKYEVKDFISLNELKFGVFLNKISKYFNLTPNFLAKYSVHFDFSKLLEESEVERTEKANDSEHKDWTTKVLFERLEKLSTLKAIPTIAAEVLKLASTTETNLNKLLFFIEKDQALTSKIITVANTVYFKTYGKVETIKKAIINIGFQNMKEIVMNIAIMDSFKINEDHKKLNKLKYWEHSISTALYAKYIGNLNGLNDSSDLLYLCGLLHDLGIGIMSNELNLSYQKIFEILEKNTLIEAEQKTFGIDHVRILEFLMKRWNFHETVVSTISRHHSPLSEVEKLSHPKNKFGEILIISDLLSNLFDFGFLPELTIDEDSARIFQNIILKEEDLFRFNNQIVNYLEQLKSTFFYSKSAKSSTEGAIMKNRRIRIITKYPDRFNIISAIFKSAGAEVLKSDKIDFFADPKGIDYFFIETRDSEDFRLHILQMEMERIKDQKSHKNYYFFTTEEIVAKNRNLLKDIDVNIVNFKFTRESLLEKFRLKG